MLMNWRHSGFNVFSGPDFSRAMKLSWKI